MGPVETVLAVTGTFGGLGIGAMATFMGIRLGRRARELEHVERMKALEVGRTLPQDEPWLSPTKIGALIGVLVPIVAFTTAGNATASAGYHEEMWIVAGVAAAASAIAGAILVGYSHGRRPTPERFASLKPHVEEDAYDVVSSRG